MARLAVMFNGPVGVGKTTTGQAVAHRLGDRAAFIDGDSFGSSNKPWHEKIHLVHDGIVRTALAAFAEGREVALIAYPLRDEDWTVLKERLSVAEVRLRVITLAASIQAVAYSGRSRVLSPDEIARSAEMMDEGYDRRGFSDLIIDTGANDLPAVAGMAADAILAWMSARTPPPETPRGGVSR